MSKATPGPWKTGHVLNGDLWVGPDYNQTLVCRIEDERDERHANARLIAAAPELLEALKDLLTVAQILGAAREETAASFAAIAKAEGRS